MKKNNNTRIIFTSALQTEGPVWKLGMYAFLVLALAEAVGTMTLRIGPGQVTLPPTIWALIIGAAAAGLLKSAGPFALNRTLQVKAGMIVQPASLLLAAKLGLMVGSSLPGIAGMGRVFLFQQLGHAVGSIVAGLPLALLLGLRREAIGATFSAGRETSLTIIAERYGIHSPEGHGVLVEYVTGAAIGAVFIALLAEFVTSLHIFHPLALAMGAGIGSGSMMAAAAGTIAAQQTPQLAQQVVTLAAASNLFNAIVGTCCALFVSLPLATWSYRLLGPLSTQEATSRARTDRDGSTTSVAVLRPAGYALACGLTGMLTLCAHWIGYRVAPSASIPGMLVLIAVVLAAGVLYRLSGKRVPAVCWVSLGAMWLTSPACPWAGTIAELAGKVSMAALLTPVLTWAGLSVAQDLSVLRKSGWRMVLVSLAAFAGAFLSATAIAELFY